VTKESAGSFVAKLTTPNEVRNPGIEILVMLGEIVEVATRSLGTAMAAQVDEVNVEMQFESMPREFLVTAAVLTKAVNHQKRTAGALGTSKGLRKKESAVS
jgi:hypothetical protein